LDLDLLADRKVILAAVGTVGLAVVVAASDSKEEHLQRRNNKRDYIFHQRIDNNCK